MPKNTSTQTRLAEEVTQLRTELAALRQQLATEVRTRRVVVIDEGGVERISAHVDRWDSAEVRLNAGATASDTEVIIHATADEGESASIGLWGGGNCFADLVVHRDAPDVDTYTGQLAVTEPDNSLGVVIDHAGLRNRSYGAKVVRANLVERGLLPVS